MSAIRDGAVTRVCFTLCFIHCLPRLWAGENFFKIPIQNTLGLFAYMYQNSSKILYGSDQKTLNIHLKRLRSDAGYPVRYTHRTFNTMWGIRIR